MDGDILLTGATGFLGSHLLEALIKTNQVIILKRSFSNMWRIAHLEDRFISYDIDNHSIQSVFAENNIRAVIHTAVNYGKDDTSKSQIVCDNIVFPLRLIEAASSGKVDVFINSDTFFNTGSLKNKYLLEYTLSKKQFVEWLNCFPHGMKIINMKLQHIYGPADNDDKFIPTIINQLLQGSKEIKLTKGDQKRDFVYIEDVVNAYVKVLESLNDFDYFEEIDVGTGKKYTVKEFVTMAKELTINVLGNNLNTRLNFGALPYREGDMMDVEANTLKLKQTGWDPNFDIDSGLSKTIKYYLEKIIANN